MSTAIVLAVVTGLLLFAGIWVLVTGLLAALSGWPRLAATFPGGPPPIGSRLRGQVLGVGSIREQNVTTLIPAPAGLYLYCMPLFRFRRPPVLVPWGRVRCTGCESFLWSRWLSLDLGGVTSIRVRQRIAPQLREHGVTIPAD